MKRCSARRINNTFFMNQMENLAEYNRKRSLGTQKPNLRGGKILIICI